MCSATRLSRSTNASRTCSAVGRGRPGWQIDIYVVNSDTRSTNSRVRRSPTLRENPANCGTHFLYHPMRLLAPGISEIHANNAPILGINVTRDPAFFLQRRQHSGDAAGTGLQRRCQLRWRLRPLHGQLPEHELLTMGSTSEFPLHCRTIAPHAGIQFTNCFLLKSHKSTIHSHSPHGRAPQTPQEYLTP